MGICSMKHLLNRTQKGGETLLVGKCRWEMLTVALGDLREREKERKRECREKHLESDP